MGVLIALPYKHAKTLPNVSNMFYRNKERDTSGDLTYFLEMALDLQRKFFDLMHAKKIAFTILIITIFSLIIFRVLSPRLLSSKIHAEVGKRCPECTLHIKKLRLSWFPLTVMAVGIEFKDDPASNPIINISANELEARFQFLSLFRKAPRVQSITAGGLDVIIQERSLNTPNTGPKYPPTGFAFKSFPPVYVDKIKVDHSKFVYQHLIHGKIAPIHLQSINLETGSFVTRDWLLSKGYNHPLKIRTTARLENSGSVLLQISFDPFAQKNHDEIEIKVKNQNLETLNSFFEVEEGIQLSGVLQDGNAMMHMSEGQLSGTLTTIYKDVQFKFIPTPERGPVTSFFSTLLHSVMISKTRPKLGSDPKKDEKTLPQAAILAKRNAYEPITKLLIRGLLDAVKKILRN